MTIVKFRLSLTPSLVSALVLGTAVETFRKTVESSGIVMEEVHIYSEEGVNIKAKKEEQNEPNS